MRNSSNTNYRFPVSEKTSEKQGAEQNPDTMGVGDRVMQPIYWQGDVVGGFCRTPSRMQLGFLLESMGGGGIIIIIVEGHGRAQSHQCSPHSAA